MIVLLEYMALLLGLLIAIAKHYRIVLWSFPECLIYPGRVYADKRSIHIAGTFYNICILIKGV